LNRNQKKQQLKVCLVAFNTIYKYCSISLYLIINQYSVDMVKIKSGFMGERAIVLPAPIIEDLKNDGLGCLLHITDIGFYPKADFHFRKRTKEEANNMF